MISVPSYLWLSRHSIFYFRIVVPEVLRPLFPCSEIRRSLQTRCKREALIRGRELLLQVQQLYTQAFQGIQPSLDSLRGAWEAGGKRVASWAAWLRQQQLVALAKKPSRQGRGGNGIRPQKPRSAPSRTTQGQLYRRHGPAFQNGASKRRSAGRAGLHEAGRHKAPAGDFGVAVT